MNRKPKSIDCIDDVMAVEVDPLQGTDDLAQVVAPVFLEGDQHVDIPANITTANARQLFGVRPGESMDDALGHIQRQAQGVMK